MQLHIVSINNGLRSDLLRCIFVVISIQKKNAEALEFYLTVCK